MALVRVYCGLASAQQSEAPVPTGAPLTAAVVDDSGRLLDVCEIGDDPGGYARLAALLAERSNGSTGVAIAADSDQHLVTALFNAAGRPLAFADEEAVDDYAERFTDDESAEEIEAPQTQRRAVGLARALQAGALSAVAGPTPPDLAGYTPVLAALGALINGRQAAAVALREVLRELYPAALRAYPDPAEPVSLAVLDALPEPSLLGGSSSGRGRESAGIEAVTARLADEGVADSATLAETITALQVAISETPRRTTTKAMTAAIAETVRQAVAAVRTCDAACETLVGTLTGRVSAPATTSHRGAGRRAARSESAPVKAPTISTPTVPAPAAASRSGRDTTELGDRLPPSPPRRSRQQPPSVQGAPRGPLPLPPQPMAPPPVPPRPAAPAATGMPPGPHSAPSPGSRMPTPPPLRRQHPGAPQGAPISGPPPVTPSSGPPVSGSPPGMAPAVPNQRGNVPPAEAGEPFRATLTTAAIQSARAERLQRVNEGRRQSEPSGVEGPPPLGINASDVSIPIPTAKPTSAVPAEPGSRANWPLVTSSDDRSSAPPAPLGFAQYGDSGANQRDSSGPGELGKGPGRVTPPWQADDLPPEPPVLRLVEPAEPERPGRTGLSPLDRTSHDPLGAGPLDGNSPPLRLVEPDLPRNGSRRGPDDLPPAPISDEGDGDLLIFAAARSAWFTGHDDASDKLEWSSSADAGWRAAEQAAQPAVGAETEAGLPKRVPQANLVPGSPLREERQFRIVRDPASIAAHTTGYFRGWRRGQEIGGYAVGGRPGRESAGGWDFARDNGGQDDSNEYEYRSAGYRS